MAGENTTIWASGSQGVVLRSKDAGKNWEQLRIPNGETLDFRGVQAFDVNVAYVMSSGEGDKSRIYKTMDGGKNWEMQYTDKRKGFFLDGIACISTTNCFALSDPVDGKFLLLHTEDGKTWKEMPGRHDTRSDGEGRSICREQQQFADLWRTRNLFWDRGTSRTSISFGGYGKELDGSGNTDLEWESAGGNIFVGALG